MSDDRIRNLLGLSPSVSVKVASQADAESASAVVCLRVDDMPDAAFPDDVIADCAFGCGFRIRHRPYVPATPPKVCMQCAIPFAAARIQ